MGLPIADAIDHVIASARELDAAAEKTSREREQSFGSRITQAVKAKLAKRQPSHVTADADNESFAERLKKTVQRRSGAKRQKEYAERERERYEEQRKSAIGE
jgi:uncharacterized lipoprotein YmbA